MTYTNVLGATTGLGGGAAVAVLPNTGGSRSVVIDIALLSVAVGLAVLVSTAVRAIAKRYYSV